MVLCPKCSTDLSKTDQNCPFCGSDRATGNAFCPECRADLVSVRRRCPFCGYDLLSDGKSTPWVGNALLTLGQILSVLACVAIVVAMARLDAEGKFLIYVAALLGILISLALLVVFTRVKKLPPG